MQSNISTRAPLTLYYRILAHLSALFLSLYPILSLFLSRSRRYSSALPGLNGKTISGLSQYSSTRRENPTGEGRLPIKLLVVRRRACVDSRITDGGEREAKAL